MKCQSCRDLSVICGSPVSDEDFEEMLSLHFTEPLARKEEELQVQTMIEEHPNLKSVTERLIQPEKFEGLRVPSRLLFTGPSGCGKTRTAIALAQYCARKCIFVRGSAVNNTYLNSGTTFIHRLFNGMLERKHQKFMLILDELSAIVDYSADGKDMLNMQRKDTAQALWQKLDDCADKQHICVIGTDNSDPDDFSEPIKKRFANNIFRFRYLSGDSLVRMMKNCLKSSELQHKCSDAFLQTLAQSSSHLSMREIAELIDEAEVLAIMESKDQKAVVQERHLAQVFSARRNLGLLEDVWSKREKHFNNLTSPRAISIGMALAGQGLRAYSERYLVPGSVLEGTGMLLNYCARKDEKDPGDLPLLSATGYMATQVAGYRQWKASHDLNEESHAQAQKAREKDKEQSKELSDKQDVHFNISQKTAKQHHKESMDHAVKQAAVQAQQFEVSRADVKAQLALAIKSSEAAEQNHKKDVKVGEERHDDQMRQSGYAQAIGCIQTITSLASLGFSIMKPTN